MNFNNYLLRSIRIFLIPFALIYGLIVWIRNFLYDKNIIRSGSFNLPVICVGNLSVGGTGKSPMVEYLLDLLNTDFKVATLSRGYKRKTRGYLLANEKSSALDIGDEPMQFHMKFPEVAVAVGEERIEAIPQLLFDRPETEVIILDDAFQHRSVIAGLNILLTEYSNLYTRDFFLPTGDLRDLRSSSRRAKIIVVTKCPEFLSEQEKRAIVAELDPEMGQEVFFTTINYGDVFHLTNGKIRSIDGQTEVLLLTGIANPGPLKKELEARTTFYDSFQFADHHIFTIDDLTEIKNRFDRMNGEGKMIVTTEKDAVRLMKFRSLLEDVPIYVIPIKHDFLFDECEKFNKTVIGYIRDFKNNNTNWSMGRKNSKNAKPKKSHLDANTFLGILDVTRNGIGYVMVESQKKDVLVRPVDFNRAMHGDKVKVKVTKSNPRTGRVEGIVEEVLERKQLEFIGEIEVNRDFAFFLPDRSKPMPDIFIPLDKLNGASDGDRVVVRMTEWKKNSKNPHGEVISILDSSDVNDMAMKEILTEKGFPLVFPDDVMEETARIPDSIPADEIKKRRDMRDVLTFTIDPVDARDFDDAISIHKQSNGLYEIGVHIADVSFYVEEGTELDEEAYRRATSVYLPDRVLPMLPERISNELCSLRPHEDKLTFSAIFQISAKGEIKGHWIGRTVIHSNHRYTYEDVQNIIEKGEGIYQQEIDLLNHLAQKFRKQRFKEGAINFSSQEVRFKLDENAKPIGIVIKESKESHQLVEEFMLLANRVVAKEISGVMIKESTLPFPYRIHDRPDEEKLIPFVDFAKKFGHKFDVKTPHGIAASFNKMLGEVRGTPQQHVLEQLGIRTMAKAIYSTDNIGHYGLAFEHYCHFTSPIRRYPDVLVHRIVQGVLEGKPHPDKKLEQKCRHCSERERAAMESERNANKYKQVEYMSDFIGEEFEGVISGVASFGFWVETVDHKCEGLVSIQGLNEYDEFRHVESEYCLVGKRSGRTFRMGDRVWIKVISANLQRRQLDYDWILVPSNEVSEEELPKRKNPKKKK